MNAHRYVRTYIRNIPVKWIAGKVSLVLLFGLLVLGVMLGMDVRGAHAQTLRSCAGGDRAYTVVGGDTLNAVAARYGTAWNILASHNGIANPDLIFIGEKLCIPQGKIAVRPVMSQPSVQPAYSSRGAAYNIFPFGACTWWADQRYYQLHGTYVPWTTNSNAWQWTARAYQFGWHVSSTPRAGAIMDLQPGVQGAGWLGHVGVVEQVRANGTFIASSMNWNGNTQTATNWTFHAGAGVTFLYR